MNSTVKRQLVLATVAGAAALLGAAFTPGCSLASNTTAVQCTSEAECLSRGPAFVGTTCDKLTKTCVKIPEDSDLCTRNQECIERAGGAPAICKKSSRKCVTLTTPECPSVISKAGQLQDDNTIVLGLLSAAGASFDSGNGEQMQNAAALAQTDISRSVKGLPAFDGSSNVRPIVLVACQEFAGGKEGLIRAANHLKDVGVPAVIGPIDGSNQVAVNARVFSQAGILNIIPFRTTLFDIPSPISPTPLVWSLSFTDRQITGSAAQLVARDLEPRLRASGVTGPIRVALLVEDSPLGQASASLLESQLSFNGKSAAANGTDNPPAYVRLRIADYNDTVANPAPETSSAAAVAALVNPATGFKPHIVLHAYTPASLAGTFVPLQLQWPGATPRPYQIDLVSIFPLLQPVADMVDNFGLHGLTFSQMGRVADQERVNQWLVKYKSEYPNITNFAQTESQVVQTWYDAVYFAAYAIAANGSRPLTGANLAQTLPKLVSGQPIKIGTDDLQKAFGLLGSGQGITIDGITGSLVLDTKTGAPVNPDMNITCPEKGPMGRTVRYKPSGFFTASGTGQGSATACSP